MMLLVAEQPFALRRAQQFIFDFSGFSGGAAWIKEQSLPCLQYSMSFGKTVT